MRGRRGRRPYVGCITMLAGVIIILALILPEGFWWFALAIALICCGAWLWRCY